MTLRDLCQRWFGLGAPDRRASDYRRDLESASRSFRAYCTDVMRSVFPSSLVHLLLRYCDNGQFGEAPLFIQQNGELGCSGWKWVSSDELVLQLQLSQILETAIMRGVWTNIHGFSKDVLFLMFKYRGLSFYPVFDVSHELLTNMLTCHPTCDRHSSVNVLYYIPPFQCPMSRLIETVSSNKFNCVADFLLDIHSPVRLSEHYQLLFLLYHGQPVWVLSPQVARVSPETISVTRLLYMMEHVSFFSVKINDVQNVATVLHYQ